MRKTFFMAEIINHKTHSTIQVTDKLHFVFGSLETNESERLMQSFQAMEKYFEVIGEEKPEVQMNWKKGIIGDWVLSDDLRIIQILHRIENKPTAFNKAIIRTCVGTFAVNDVTYFDTDFEMHPDRYRINANPQDHTQKLYEREDLTSKEQLFARRMAMGDDPTKAYMRSFPTEDQGYANNMSKILLRQERIGNAINDEVEQLLADEGVSKRYIIQKYKELVDDGILDLKNCAPSVRAALRDLADMSAMMPSKTKQSATRGALEEINDERLAQIEMIEQKVKMKEIPESFEQEFVNVDDISDEDYINEIGKSLLQ